MTSDSKKSKADKFDDPTPRIGIIGVGGAGGNAINNMIRAELQGVNYLAANTDAQALAASLAEHVLQLGVHTTAGLGSGAQVATGRAAAEESIDEIRKWVSQCDLLFIAAGMGGGTGTGAAPVIAEIAKEEQALSVGVITLPFDFEGPARMKAAVEGMEDLEKHVDTLIVIPNQNLFAVANANTTFANAFLMADEVLHDAIRGITDLIVLPGLINLDFADVEAVIQKMGRAMMGTGEASGDKRALEAAEAAIANPLLDIVSIKGAEGLLINVSGGADMTLFEIDEAANRIRAEVGNDSLVIFGSAFDPSLDGTLRVSVVATGLKEPGRYTKRTPEPEPTATVDPEPETEPEDAPETDIETATFSPPSIEPTMDAVMAAVMEHSREEQDLKIDATEPDPSTENNNPHPIPTPTIPKPQTPREDAKHDDLSAPEAPPAWLGDSHLTEADGIDTPEPETPVVPEGEEKNPPKKGWLGKIFSS